MVLMVANSVIGDKDTRVIIATAEVVVVTPEADDFKVLLGVTPNLTLMVTTQGQLHMLLTTTTKKSGRCCN